MKAAEFCYWLQGYFEVANPDGKGSFALSSAQGETVQRHLALVFKHELDSAHGDAKAQATLNSIHRPGNAIGGDDEVYRC